MAQENRSQQTFDPNRLIGEGSSQTQRHLAALSGSYAQVDEHRLADWIVFASRYAAYVRFFDAENIDVGDWRPFFDRNPATLLAVAAVQPVDEYTSAVTKRFRNLLSILTPDAVLQVNLAELFNIAATLAKQLDWLKETLPDGIGLKGVLRSVIQLQLGPALGQLMAYFNAAKTMVILPTNPVAGPSSLNLLGAEVGQFVTLIDTTFSKDWFLYHKPTVNTWAEHRATLGQDARIFVGDSTAKRIRYAAAHNLFTDVFDLFGKAFARVVAEAQNDLKVMLNGKDDHEPHFALYLTFLRLFEYARDHLNQFTQRHLDFYYKEVLQLKEKPAVPNHAHLVFQLAKHVDSHLLTAGTRCRAGKDSIGQMLHYALDEDTVLNSARVVQLKAVQRTDTTVVANGVRVARSQLYAFPAANSSDGRGAELETIDKQWHPFQGLTEPANFAQVGFAIASHFLLLREGQRQIQLTLNFAAVKDLVISQQAVCAAFEFYLTSADGWLPVIPTLDPNSAAPAQNGNVQITLDLDGGKPAIVPLQSALHKRFGLPAGLPTLVLVLKQVDTGANPLLTLRELQQLAFNPINCKLLVRVGYTKVGQAQYVPDGSGIKNLAITTKFGPVIPDKPFQPFGPMPEIGDSLIIGNDEAFQKQGANLQFRTMWKGLPDWRGNIDFDWVNEFFPSVNLTVLENGAWKAGGPNTDDIAIFDDIQPVVVFPSSALVLSSGARVSPVRLDLPQLPFTLDRRTGFVRLTLNGDFGHKLYQATLARHLVYLAQGNAPESNRNNLRDIVYKLDNNGRYVPKNPYTFFEDFVNSFLKAVPVPPYTPEIESLTLSYTAETRLSDAALAMYWLTPFGSQPTVPQVSSAPHVVKLLPTYDNAGEFYIGLQGLKPAQNLSLLFQVAEGSADPTVDPKNLHLQWQYLSGNDWKTFETTALSDATMQLTRSGIIRFAMPKDATLGDSIFGVNDCHWLRASVSEFPQAVCKLISVTAQAARVTFQDQGNSPEVLQAQLPAGSISKLDVPDLAIKKVEQPYPTFGGQAKEVADSYYTRVSERLRHKDRAIAAWDYEHLILEAFPWIYKVKCLNHTRFEPQGNHYTYDELAAGHVTIVTIPNLHNHNAIDPLHPYTNVGDLNEIEAFVAKLVSCFVRLHVQNPIFEAVRVQFKVKFFPGIDENFHLKLLNQEIIRYLSPWAFAEGSDVAFGGRVYKSSLIDFVEEQPYVDYVTDFQLSRQTDATTPDNSNVEMVEASTAISILVSAPNHDVTAIHADESDTLKETCTC